MSRDGSVEPPRCDPEGLKAATRSQGLEEQVRVMQRDLKHKVCGREREGAKGCNTCHCVAV